MITPSPESGPKESSGPLPPPHQIAGNSGTGAPPRPILERLRAYRTLWLLGLIVFALDQLTKYWIDARLPLGSYGPHGIPVIPGFLNFVHVGNTGAAWSMFSGKSTGLALLAGGTLLAIFFWRRHLGLKHPPVQLSFGLLCGGILGNLVDRLVHGHVIDFIDMHFGSYVYPTFNVADSGICVGVFWYVLWSLRNPHPDGTKKPASRK